MYIKTALTNLALLLYAATLAHSAIIPVESASYTTTFPGVDEKGRNGYPEGSPHNDYQALSIQY
jgi:hypothetical protein